MSWKTAPQRIATEHDNFFTAWRAPLLRGRPSCRSRLTKQGVRLAACLSNSGRLAILPPEEPKANGRARGQTKTAASLANLPPEEPKANCRAHQKYDEQPAALRRARLDHPRWLRRCACRDAFGDPALVSPVLPLERRRSRS